MTSAAMMIVAKISVTIMSVLASFTVYGGILLVPYFISVPKANGVLAILFYVLVSKCAFQYSTIDTLNS